MRDGIWIADCHKIMLPGFFCQLLATKILTVELLICKSEALVIACTLNDRFVYNDPVNWEGMQFRKRGRGSTAVPFNILVNSVVQAQRMVWRNIDKYNNYLF